MLCPLTLRIYIRNKYKIPHYEFVLLETALLSDESSATLSWVMRTWLRAMGGEAPKAIVSESVKNVVKQNEEEFMVKFEECIYRPWTDEELEESGENLVDMFELKEKELFLSLEFVADSVSKRQLRELSVVEDPMQSMNSNFVYAVDVSESVKNVVKQNEEEFMVKFEECIYKPWTDEELEESGKNLVDMFELKEKELFLSLECLALQMQSMNFNFFYAVDVSESVKNVVKQNEEEFMVKFEECIYRPWTDEELEESGKNLVDMFELKEKELFLSLECLALCSRFSEQEIVA
nr:protein FAR-RED ELONGATED HYPOCOTYL 3 isoform X2 [Ipomoea batatas]